MAGGFHLGNVMSLFCVFFCTTPEPPQVNKVCFGRVGCFTDALPCHNVDMASPESINTRFYLFTRSNPTRRQEISWKDLRSIQRSNFDGALPTKFIVHGWIENTGKSAFVNMKDAILENEDVNVIMVDWRGGSLDIYETSVQNIRVVGRELSILANKLRRYFYASPVKMHIIGHSLGAHAAGYAGSEISGLGRITGLDPAGPDFHGQRDNGCRLDRTDALFVDAIHTDGSDRSAVIKGLNGLGLQDEVGHQDFYPNGGKHMPGCIAPYCSHYRAVFFFTESIATCSFDSESVCESWKQIDAMSSPPTTNCTVCDAIETPCPRMGYWANPSDGVGSYYLGTGRSAPYC